MAGCAAMSDERRETFGFAFPPPSEGEPPAAVVFFADGVNRLILDEMLSAGELPSLSKYFVERGLYAERCLSGIPSVTLACQTSFVTGLFPGRHGVTGINWFDRNRLIWRDYETIDQKNTLDCDYRAATIFEHLEDATTMSLFYQAHRGATKFAENWTSAGPPYFFGWYGMVDRISLLRFGLVADVARTREAFPAYTIAYLLAPDMEAYRSGVSSPAYRAALVHTDAHIGRVLRDLEAAGRLDSTVIVFATDHGMKDVRNHWSMERGLRDTLRLKVAEKHLWEDSTFEQRLAYYQKYTCVVSGSGDRYGCISLRKPRRDPAGAVTWASWLERPAAADLRAYPDRDGRPVDVIKALRDAEAVDVVAWRAAPGLIHVATKRGVVELIRPAPGSPDVGLRTVQGDDPLGYDSRVPADMLMGKPHGPQAWLQATADTQYPDLPPQLAAYFDAPRSGDIAVFAAPEWDLRTVHKAGHGGLRPTEMLIPLLMAGPGVPHARWPHAVRAVDVVPTLLGLLGRPVPEGLDGRNLLAEQPAAGLPTK
jgi:arylsulfatase A-like enzyme